MVPPTLDTADTKHAQSLVGKASNVESRGEVDLRHGDYRDVLADVSGVDLLCADPPYSKRTHAGHDHAARGARGLEGSRRELSYGYWTADDVSAFVDFWATRNRGWFAVMSDHGLVPAYEAAFIAAGLTAFQPIPCVIRGMTVRLAGDGPSSWATYLNVARPKSLCRWGTLDGAYVGGPGEREHIGGKPLWLMRQIIRDYSRPGDLVVDPCSGSGTTLVAAAIEGRRVLGAERSFATCEVAADRVEREYTHTVFNPRRLKGRQTRLAL